MPYETIISCAELLPHLNIPDWVVIDCRFDLAQPGWGEAEYCKSHIPGAVYANMDTDLSGAKSPQTGRHPLPAPQDFLATMSRFGINEHTQVVVFTVTTR
jgi:thiosulfate/3-mercaptopyruvate sulfurtransferase